jgi:hypothetical protein
MLPILLMVQSAAAHSTVAFAPQGITVEGQTVVLVPESLPVLELPVQREGDLSSQVRLGYWVNGLTAEAGYDFATIFNYVVFQPGESWQRVRIELFPDELLEATEYLEVELVPSDSADVELGDLSKIRVGLLDAQTELPVSPLLVTTPESTAEVVVSVTLAEPAVVPVAISYRTGDGTARADFDYVGVAGSLSFQTGEQTHQVRVRILNDAIPEPTEWFQLFFLDDTGLVLPHPMLAATVMIQDSDSGFGFERPFHSVSEAGGHLRLLVSRGHDLPLPCTVEITTLQGTATEGVDYEPIDAILRFESDEAVATVEVAILNDGEREPNEVFRVVLRNPSEGFALGSTPECTVQIQDNDPGIGFSQETFSVSEQVESVTLVVERGNDFHLEPMTVEYATESISATAGADYVHSVGSLFFDEGQMATSIVIPILNDAEPENPETFQVILSNPSSIELGQNRVATIQIQDNDTGTGFRESLYFVMEGQPEVTLYVERGSDSTDPCSVDYQVLDETAMAGEDYLLSSGTLNFGVNDSVRPITVQILNDGLTEPSESFRVELTNPSPGVYLGSRICRVQIEDNDPGIGFETSDFYVVESAGTLILTVHRGNDFLLGPFNIDYSCVVPPPDSWTSPATPGLDFQDVAGVLHFAEGELTQTIIVPILNDGLSEQTEGFEVHLGSPPPGMSLRPPGYIRLWVNDNDPGVSFTSSYYWTYEDAKNVTLSVQRGNDIALEPFTVEFTAVSDTAIAGQDFAATTGTLHFEQGELLKDFSIPILNDGLHEELEWFRVQLRNVQGEDSTILGSATAEVYIEDNDWGVSWGSTWYTAWEDMGLLQLPVLRGNDADLPLVTVSYQVLGGTAASGLDFSAAEGITEIPAGQSQGHIRISILNDSLREDSEEFRVRLTGTSSPLGLAGEHDATVIILDNDPGAAFTASSWEITETNGLLELTVLRGNDVDLGPMSVDYFVRAETARPGQDCVDAAGTVTFEPGDTEKSFTIELIDDLEWEGDEQLQVFLTNHTGSGTLQPAAQATVVILDNDPLSWERIGGFPGAWDFRDIAAGNGRWIIPTTGPSILWSTNGMVWAQEPIEPDLVRVVFDGTRFLGANGQSDMFSSPDGLVWHYVGSLPMAPGWPTFFVHNGELFLVLLDNGQTAVSTDGQDWVVGALPEAGRGVRALVCGDGKFLAVTGQGHALRSADGLEWREQVVLPNGAFEAVAHGGGRFVALGWGTDPTDQWRSVLAESLDGETWSLHWLDPEDGPSEIRSLAYGHGRFIGIRDVTGWSFTPTSDGWQISRFVSFPAYRIAFDGHQFVAIDWAELSTSFSGVDWACLTANWRAACQKDGVFVVAADVTVGWSIHYSIFSSSDLTKWSAHFHGLGSIQDVGRLGDDFVVLAGGTSGWLANSPFQVVRSSDATEWTSMESELDGRVVDALCDESLLLAVGSAERLDSTYAMVWRSTDGEHWSSHELFQHGQLDRIRRTAGGYLATGYSNSDGAVAYGSSDGANWMPTQPPTEFVPDGFEPLVALQVGTSEERVWLQRADQPWLGYRLPGGSYVRDVIYAEGHLLAVGDRGSLWKSSPLIQVEPPRRIVNPLGAEEWHLTVWGPPGSLYELEAAEDLNTWTSLGTVPAPSDPVDLILPNPLPNPTAHYYRVRLLPDPDP